MNKNIEMLIEVAQGLKELIDSVVFVGGATASLYFKDRPSSDIRPTDDVDCIVEVSSKISYDKLSRELHKLNFWPDSSKGSPICRFKYLGIKVDIMPLTEDILGFSNYWYKEGFQNKILYTLPNQQKINILPLPYFLATKVEAFYGRGQDDPRFSHDLEDIIITLVHVDKNEILSGASPELKKFLTSKFLLFLNDSNIMEAISGHNPYPEFEDYFDKIISNLNL